MQTNNPQHWGARSLSFWLTTLIALGIIFIGARFIIAPDTAANGFGIPFATGQDHPYARIKGIRDIFSGLVLLLFLIMHMQKAAAWALISATIIPATDFSIVLSTNGPSDTQHLLIHGLTVVYMIFTSCLLFTNRTIFPPSSAS